MENEMTPLKMFEHIWHFETDYDYYCSMQGHDYHKKIYEALVEHEKQKKLLELLSKYMLVSNEPYNDYESITLQLTVADFSVFKEDFKIIKEWLENGR